jgi:hemerythrin-like domain-containing protein
MSADITEMILDDHDWFRRRFLLLAELRDDADRVEEARQVWDELARHLEVHASAEEEHFYPSMARRADDEEASATEDAVGDHDDIRAAARKAFAQEVGSEDWWSAIEECDQANNHHMSEEESDDLEPFRRVTSLAFRQELGAKFEQFKSEHAGAKGLDFQDKDPDAYVEAVTE